MSNEKVFLQKKINKGMALLDKNNFSEATKIFEYLKKQKQTEIIALLFLGIIEIKKKNHPSAKNLFYNILNIEPNNEDANLNLALVFFDEKNYDKTLLYLNKVIEINKNNLTAIYHKGLVYFFIKDLKLAIKFFEICINLNKNFMYSYLNLGHIYLRSKQFEKALDYYKKVLEIEPNHNTSKFNISLCYFGLNDFHNGYKYYEFRKEKMQPKEKTLEVQNKYKCSEWLGESLNGKKILIITEQGIGDNIQYFRYLFMLEEKFKVKVIFYVSKKLLHLFKNSPFEIVSNLNGINDVDYYQHLMSLPGIFYKEKKKFGKCINYIKPENNNDLKWKKKLNSLKRPIIGLNWQGDKNYLSDDTRSVSLSLFKNILNYKNCTFISLQKGFGSEQIKLYNFSNSIVDLSNDIDLGDSAFEDTISILKNIDLLITSDTSICHLAGTLNVKTCLMLSYNPDWRWFIELKDKCFYPSMKIIQQNSLDDWSSVMKEIHLYLQNEIF